jgi:histidine ammonia-lyase
MIPQYTAVVVSQNNYATPSSIDSIVSSNGQEDMLVWGKRATKALRVMDNIERICNRINEWRKLFNTEDRNQVFIEMF